MNFAIALEETARDGKIFLAWHKCQYKSSQANFSISIRQQREG
jgi:hypothetical protein